MPLVCFRVVIVVHIFMIAHVRVVDREVHRVEGEVVFEIEVGFPLRLRGASIVQPLEGK